MPSKMSKYKYNEKAEKLKSLERNIDIAANNNDGWLSPAGSFSGTDGISHCEEAQRLTSEKYGLRKYSDEAHDKINSEGILEKLGYLKLKSNKWYSLGKELTQPQIDFLFYWCLETGKTYPPKIIEVG